MNTKFSVVVPVYNAEQYVQSCILSILKQNYENFTVIVTDDLSTDSTRKILDSNVDGRIVVIKNTERKGALHNIVNMIAMSDDDSVIVTVDGDDRLAHENVLSKLDEVYRAGAWMTYGQFIPTSGRYGKYCRKIPKISEYRKSDQWLASHLRTFKKTLWNRIDDKDLKDQLGQYYMTAWDAAFMYPMLEMSGDSRAVFIDEVLYLYTDTNPISDMRVSQQSQIKNAEFIKSLASYSILENL